MVSVVEPELAWSKTVPVRFASSVLIGVFMFLVVGAAAVGLHYFVEWMTASGLEQWMIKVAKSLEYFLYAADVAVFAVYMVRTTVRHLMMLFKKGAIA